MKSHMMAKNVTQWTSQTKLKNHSFFDTPIKMFCMVKIYSCYDEIKTLFEPQKKLSLTFDGKKL